MMRRRQPRENLGRNTAGSSEMGTNLACLKCRRKAIARGMG